MPSTITRLWPRRRRSHRRLDLGHHSDLVGDVSALRQVEKYQGVAERIRDDRDTADGNVDRLAKHITPGSLNLSDSFIGGGNEPVRRILLTRGQNDLGLTARQADRGLPDLIVAPHKPMSQRVTIETQPGIKIRNGNRDGIDGLKQRVSGLTESGEGAV
jgi:hypothetical protein